VFKDRAEVHIASRDGKALERYFPELVPALKAALPERAVVDGEVIVQSEQGLDFDSLQMRIHPARSRIEKLAREIPASVVVFDLIALGDEDLRTTPLQRRRELLATMVPDGSEVAQAERATRVLLTPQTSNTEEAQRWFVDFEGLGLDGLIAKRADLHYLPGERAMVKVKHQRTADCVVGGYRLSKSGDGVASLLLGLYDDDGVLHYVGHTSSFKAQERHRLLEELRPLEGEGGFGGGRSPGGPSRWTGTRDISWVGLEPVLVCEVAFDHMQGDRFRHAARLLRWRDDKPPRACTFDQLR
jgi:ATP-dependent DNA ligase